MQPSDGDERFRQLAANLPDFVIILDRERRIRWVNRVAPGLTWEQIEGTRTEEWIAPECRADAIAAVEACFETGDHTHYRVAAYGDGITLAHYESRVVPFAANTDAPHVLVLTRDITTQVNAINELRDSQNRLARAMSSGRIGLWEFDPEAGTVHRNPQLAEMLGLPELDSDPNLWLQRVHPDDRERITAGSRALASGELDTAELEYRVLATDGSTHWFIDRAARQQLPSGKLLVTGVMFDTTELRRIEQERLELLRALEQAQRLESIGLLAGGIAHDFNNLLMIIQTSAELAAQLRDEGQPIDEELDCIKSACSRAASLTRQLLAFGRRNELQVRALDLVEVVREVSELVRRLLPEHIAVELALPEHELLVTGDRHQLEQVLVNLCINARDAMPGGGKLRLGAARVDDEVELSITDTGSGIAERDLAHIFEPFYTTKTHGSGSGLGLAMVHGIIQQHRGTISVTSEVGVGSQFRVRLPVTKTTSTKAPPDTASPPVGHARLLVAEDEARILDMLERILTRAGYEVVTAVDGQDALDKWREHGGNFDLVVLDAMMPRLDGWGAYEQLRRLDPSVPILFSSGYAVTQHAPMRAAAGQDAGELPQVLSKPYEPDTLLRVVGQLLAQRR